MSTIKQALNLENHSIINFYQLHKNAFQFPPFITHKTKILIDLFSEIGFQFSLIKTNLNDFEN
jgi:hypothetical protein